MKGGQEIIRATLTSGRGCGGTIICHKKGQQSFSESKFGPHPPPPQSKITGSTPAQHLHPEGGFCGGLLLNTYS